MSNGSLLQAEVQFSRRVPTQLSLTYLQLHGHVLLFLLHAAHEGTVVLEGSVWSRQAKEIAFRAKNWSLRAHHSKAAEPMLTAMYTLRWQDYNTGEAFGTIKLHPIDHHRSAPARLLFTRLHLRGHFVGLLDFRHLFGHKRRPQVDPGLVCSGGPLCNPRASLQRRFGILGWRDGRALIGTAGSQEDTDTHTHLWSGEPTQVP